MSTNSSTAIRQDPSEWKYESPSESGMHAVVTPENSPCRSIRMFRLNLKTGDSHRMLDTAMEFVVGLVEGAVEVRYDDTVAELARMDSFYLPGGACAELVAKADSILYVGGAAYEGVGRFFVRRFDLALPLGEIHQIHGKPPYEREVFMTLNPEVPASRLIAGWTFSRAGGWTSWPPHQHEQDLEEVYAYFDMPDPSFGLHLSYRKPGVPEAVHQVRSGDMVIAPSGYHPTVAIPGARNCYFWVLAAHRLSSRSYDLAVLDPKLANE